jgi:hypothetical protein
MLLPPAQYDHPPTIPVIERVLPWNELQPGQGATLAASGQSLVETVLPLTQAQSKIRFRTTVDPRNISPPTGTV